MGLFSFTQEVAIDLGTANTIITCNDKMVVDEPSVIALDARSDKVLAVGMWKEEWQTVKKSLNSLKGYIITDGVALKPTYIVSDDDNVRPYCISNVVGYLIQKMNSYPELKALLH